MSNTFIALAVPALLLLSAIFILLFGLSSYYTKNRAYYITLATLFIAFFISINGIGVLHSAEILPQIFNSMIVYDTFSATFISLFLLGGFLTLAIAKSFVDKTNFFTHESFVLFLLSLFGMVILTMANELLTAFISLEIASMSVYILVGLNRDSLKASEAFFKYLLLGSFAASFYLLGMMLIFAQTKSTNLDVIAEYILNTDLNSQLLVVAGSMLIMITIMFKIAAVPFGAWVLDVYEGASLPITAYMAGVFKIAIFAFALRVFLKDYITFQAIYDPLIIGGALITMAVGSLLAVIQQSVKKMLAASSVVHSGYLLIAFASTGEATSSAASAIIFYLFAYFISAIGAFGVLSYISKGSDNLINYDDLNGLAKERPIIAASLTVFMLSLAGFPSTIGFIGKFYIFTSAIEAGYTFLAFFGALSAFISIYYYFKVIVHLYFKESGHLEVDYGYKVSLAFIVISALIVLWGGVGTSLLLDIPGINALNALSKYSLESLGL
ncbi:NADH-quinone oxidoreductase subunit N [bacterium]|nr:NADH-quinone oxidoreductase subunit N [bacterium]MBU1993585.1 NADH-quinone oxidoreductase subunit N [bacterium]